MQTACTMAVRPQRQWALEADLAEATASGKLYHKSEKAKQTPVTVSGNVHGVTQAFEAHWRAIVHHDKVPEDAEAEGKRQMPQQTKGKTLEFYSNDLFDKTTRMLQKMKKGKTGGTDGVLA